MFGSTVSLTQQVRRVLAAWLTSLAVINFLYHLPHADLHILTWVNHSFFFLIFVLCIFIALKDEFMKDVFMHFTAWAFFIVLGVCTSFILYQQGPYAKVYLGFYLSFYNRAVIYTLFLVGTIYLSLKYVLWRLPRYLNLLISWTLGILLNIDFWYHSVAIPRFPFYATSRGNGLPIDLIELSFRSDAVAIVFLLLYCWVLLKRNKPTAVFLNLWAVGITFFAACDFIDLWVTLNQKDVYGIDQYFSIICLMFLIAILFLRYISLFSEEYQLRERFIFDPIYANLSLSVVASGRQTAIIIDQLKSLIQNINIYLQFTLGIALILISSLASNQFITVKMFFMVFLIAVIWLLYSKIYIARLEDGQVLNQRFIKKQAK
jgi:hypothetical protein